MTRATILYDDDCGFCVWCLTKVLALDRGRRLRPVALQDPYAEALLEGMDRDARMASWHLVTEDGRVFSAGAAFVPLMTVLPVPGAIAGLLERAPRLVDRAYFAVAERRTALGRLLPAAARRRSRARLERRRSGQQH